MSMPLTRDRRQIKLWLGAERKLPQKPAKRGIPARRRCDRAGQPIWDIMDSITGTSDGLFNSQN